MCTIAKKKIVYKRFLVFAVQGAGREKNNRTQRAVAHVDSTNSNECPCCTSNKVSYAMDVKFSNGGIRPDPFLVACPLCRVHASPGWRVLMVSVVVGRARACPLLSQVDHCRRLWYWYFVV